MDEEEVQNLFYLIDTDKKGVITPQDALLAKELIRERFCIDEVGYRKETDHLIMEFNFVNHLNFIPRNILSHNRSR